MTNETTSILNDPGLVALRDAGLARLAELWSGRTPDQPFVLAGQGACGQVNLYQDPATWMTEALDTLAGKAEGLRDAEVFRPLAINPWPYGVHFVDRILGASVYELDGETDNWQARTLDTPVGQLATPNLESDPTWALARRIAEAFLSADVCVPFFGPPVLSSPLNIGLNLYGQALIEAMLLDPSAARGDLRTITDLIVCLHQWYQQNIPPAQLQMIEIWGRIQPLGHGQICGCSTQLLSPELYAEFIAPLDNEILSLYPRGGMIHLCGSHAQHIDTWRDMASVCAVQVNDRASEDLEHYFKGLREDQIIYVNRCDGMRLGRVMEITGGRRVVHVGD